MRFYDRIYFYSHIVQYLSFLVKSVGAEKGGKMNPARAVARHQKKKKGHGNRRGLFKGYRITICRRLPLPQLRRQR